MEVKREKEEEMWSSVWKREGGREKVGSRRDTEKGQGDVKRRKRSWGKKVDVELDLVAFGES